MSEENEVQAAGPESLFVAAYTDEGAAHRALESLVLTDLEPDAVPGDAAVIRMDADGKVHFEETGDTKPLEGAALGSLVGAIIGVLAGPAGVLAGAAGGAAAGGLGALKDAGFDDDSLQRIGAGLIPGSSALVVGTSHAAVKAVRKEVPEEDVLATATDVGLRIRGRLEAGSDMLLSLTIGDEGFSASEVVANDDALAVFRVAGAEGAVAAGAAVVTEDGVLATGEAVVVDTEGDNA